eukprot:2616072-Prymnesium_polylepis.2
MARGTHADRVPFFRFDHCSRTHVHHQRDACVGMLLGGWRGQLLDCSVQQPPVERYVLPRHGVRDECAAAARWLLARVPELRPTCGVPDHRQHERRRATRAEVRDGCEPRGNVLARVVLVLLV